MRRIRISFAWSVLSRQRGPADHQYPRRCFSVLKIGPLLVGALWSAIPGTWASQLRPLAVHGLPFIRHYSYREIGEVSAGARLGFDPIGRLLVVYQGDVFALNDATWLNLTSDADRADQIVRIAGDRQGHDYFGGDGSWGTIGFDSAGKLRPRSFAPLSPLDWIKATAFTKIVTTAGGVYFSDFNGVVYWDRASRKNLFFPADGKPRLIAVGNRVFLYSQGLGLEYIDVASHSLRKVDDSALGTARVDHATRLDRTTALVATSDGRLLTFDGKHFAPWASALGARLRGRVSRLQRLAGGGLAVAVTGDGLYLTSRSGQIICSLTDPENQRVIDLAAREPDVLWIATEDGVEKVLYRSPVTIIDERLGLPVRWPRVVRWRDRIVIATDGRLYEASPNAAVETRFHLVAGQPAGTETWGIASAGSHLLVGNHDGVFARKADGSFVGVISGFIADRLVMVGPDFCYVIGRKEIGALHWKHGRWSECAARVPAAGYPEVVHAIGKAAWIELMGGDRVERVSYRNGRLHTRLFSPWSAPGRINIGFVGDTVVLTPNQGRRRFFDERSDRFVEAPELRRLLSRAPSRILRIQSAGADTLWASDKRGVFVLHREASGYRIDATTFSMIDNRNLQIHLLPDGEVWFSNEMSLYHVESSFSPDENPKFDPVLVSIKHGRTVEPVGGSRPLRFRFPYADNSLSLRFFSGSYAYHHSPVYEFRQGPRSRLWTSLGTSSLLTLPDLREGNYRVEIRLTKDQVPLVKPLAVAVRIDPPWFRNRYAYALYGIAAIIAALGLARWSAHRVLARNAELERLVEKRTGELKVAMENLNRKTSVAATLAERNRLAGEIHDSVQQGLSGLILQLDGTLKRPSMGEDIRSHLKVVRNMASFTRQDMQNAVWNMESPLLEGAGLGDALRNFASLISPDTVPIEVAVAGTPVPLAPSTQHHLLRIAQEAIGNAVRHAAPGKIVVSLDYDRDTVSLTIADDGRGFLPETVLGKSLGHFGLRSLRARARELGSELHIRSAPGEGTSIKIVLPTLTTTKSDSHATGR